MTTLRAILFSILAAAVMFTLGWWAGRASAPEIVEEIVRVDTVYYERPTAIAASVRMVEVSVPRLLFAREPCKSFVGDSANAQESIQVVAYYATTGYGADCANNANCTGSCSEIPNSSSNQSEIPTVSDSVRMELSIETRTYSDSLYRAQVSGPAIAGYRPMLDWVQVYDRTVVRTETRRHRFAVTAGVGAAYTPQGFQPTIGLQVGVVLWGW